MATPPAFNDRPALGQLELLFLDRGNRHGAKQPRNQALQYPAASQSVFLAAASKQAPSSKTKQRIDRPLAEMWALAHVSSSLVGACASAALQGELRAQLLRRGGRALASSCAAQARRAAFLSAASASAGHSGVHDRARLGMAVVGAAALTVGLELQRDAAFAHARAALETEREAMGSERAQQRWQLFDQIGAGAFGTVRIGMHEQSGEVAAVKVVEPARNNYAALQREISALQLVKTLGGHRSIVDLKDVYVDGSKVYLVTELARGGELFDTIVDRGALSERRAGAIAHEIASALAFMHRNGLVHKDIKPENILLTTRSGADDKDDGLSLTAATTGPSLVKLADFGSAGPASTTHARMDDIGTSAYLPPELLAKGVCTAACDMWALGCVLYIMLSGSHPFDLDGTAPDSVVERRIKQDVVSFDLPAWGSVSADAKDLVAKLLHKDPALRLTADQALLHPWIASHIHGPVAQPLTPMATSVSIDAKVQVLLEANVA